MTFSQGRAYTLTRIIFCLVDLVPFDAAHATLLGENEDRKVNSGFLDLDT